MPVTAAATMPTRARPRPKKPKANAAVRFGRADGPPCCGLATRAPIPITITTPSAGSSVSIAQTRRKPSFVAKFSRRTSVPVPGSVITSCCATPAQGPFRSARCR